jgi:hypothetical protein
MDIKAADWIPAEGSLDQHTAPCLTIVCTSHVRGTIPRDLGRERRSGRGKLGRSGPRSGRPGSVWGACEREMVLYGGTPRACEDRTPSYAPGFASARVDAWTGGPDSAPRCTTAAWVANLPAPAPRAEPEAFTPGYSSVRLQFLAACTAEEDASVLLPCLRPGMSMVACGSGQGSNIVDTLMQRHRIVFARRPVQEASHGAC